MKNKLLLLLLLLFTFVFSFTYSQQMILAPVTATCSGTASSNGKVSVKVTGVTPGDAVLLEIGIIPSAGSPSSLEVITMIVPAGATEVVHTFTNRIAASYRVNFYVNTSFQGFQDVIVTSTYTALNVARVDVVRSSCSANQFKVVMTSGNPVRYKVEDASLNGGTSLYGGWRQSPVFPYPTGTNSNGHVYRFSVEDACGLTVWKDVTIVPNPSPVSYSITTESSWERKNLNQGSSPNNAYTERCSEEYVLVKLTDPSSIPSFIFPITIQTVVNYTVGGAPGLVNTTILEADKNNEHRVVFSLPTGSQKIYNQKLFTYQVTTTDNCGTANVMTGYGGRNYKPYVRLRRGTCNSKTGFGIIHHYAPSGRTFQFYSWPLGVNFHPTNYNSTLYPSLASNPLGVVPLTASHNYFNGSPLPAGTYVFGVNCNGEIEKFTLNVTQTNVLYATARVYHWKKCETRVQIWTNSNTKIEKIKFVSVPTGFHPNTFFPDLYPDPNLPGNLEVNIPLADRTHVYRADLDSSTRPDGDYVVDITACGITKRLNFKIWPYVRPVYAADITQSKGCGDNMDVKLMGKVHRVDSYNRGMNVNISNSTITAAPSAFIAQYGPLPYTATLHKTSFSTSNNHVYYSYQYDVFEGLPPGAYTIEYTATTRPYRYRWSGDGTDVNESDYICPRTETLTGNITVSPSSPNFNEALTLQVDDMLKCGSLDIKLNGSIDLHPNSKVTYKLERKENGVWVFIKDLFTTNGSATSIPVNVYEQNINVNSNGDPKSYFRINRFQENKYSTCTELSKSFIGHSGIIDLDDYNVYHCSSGGKAFVSLDVNGIKNTAFTPTGYRFTLMTRNGTSIPQVVQNTPVFYGLDQNATYEIKIEGKCAASKFVINTTNSILPKITPSNLCNNGTAKLTVSDMNATSYTWKKGSTVLTTATANTTNVLEIPNYDPAINSGSYTVTLHYSGAGSACANHDVSFNIPAGINVSAGNDVSKDYTVVESLIQGPASNGVVDLNTYLQGSVGTWGLWTNVGADFTFISQGSMVNLNTFTRNLPYEFKFAIDGGCGGIDEAIITITVKDELLAKDDVFGFLALNSSSTSVLSKGSNASPVLEDAFNENPVNLSSTSANGVTITVVSPLPTGKGVSFNPLTGKIKINANATHGNYSFTYKICKDLTTIGNTCSNTATVTFKVLKTLKQQVFDDLIICQGTTTGTYKFRLQGSQEDVNYTLYKNSVSTANKIGSTVAGLASGGPIEFTLPTPLPTATTTYVIEAVDTVLATNKLLMLDTAEAIISPLPSLSGPTDVCKGLEVTYIGTGIPATTNAYVSSHPAIAEVISPSGSVLVYKIKGVSKGTAVITYTNKVGCSITKTINVKGQPSWTAANVKVCYPATVTLNSSKFATTFTPAPIGTFKYYTNINLDPTTELTSSTISAPSGLGLNKTYYAQYSFSNGCSSPPIPINIKITKKPTINLQVPNYSMCASAPGVIPVASYDLRNAYIHPTTGPNSGGTYEYYYKPLNSSAGVTSTLLSGSTPSVVIQSGIYTIKYTLDGCSSAPAIVNVYIETPTLDFKILTPICIGEKFNLADAIKNPKSGGTYEFYDTDPAITGASPIVHGPLTNPVITADTSYWVNYIVSPVCDSGVKRFEIKVYPNIAFTPTILSAVCFGTATGSGVVVVDLEDALLTSSTALDYEYYSDITINTVTNALDPTKKLTGSALNVTQSGTYYVRSIHQIYGCISPFQSIPVSIVAKPRLNIPVVNIDVCTVGSGFKYNDIVVDPALTDVGSGYGLEYYTKNGSGIKSFISNPSLAVPTVIGTPTVYYVINKRTVAPYCLSDEVKITVTVNGNPLISASNIEYCTGIATINLEDLVTTSSPTGSYKFYPTAADAAADTSIITPHTGITPVDGTSYWATFTLGSTGASCISNIQEVKVKVNPTPTFDLKNATTPNKLTINLCGSASSPTDLIKLRELVENPSYPTSLSTTVRYRFCSDPNMAVGTDIPITQLVYTTAGTHNFFVQLENPTTGCKSIIKEIEINVDATPTLVIKDPASKCWSSTAKFNLETIADSNNIIPNVTGHSTTVGYKGYEFYSQDDITDPNNLVLTGASQNITIPANPNVDTQLVYYVTYTSDTGCKSKTYPIKLVFRPRLSTSLVEDKKLVCLPNATDKFDLKDLVLDEFNKPQYDFYETLAQATAGTPIMPMTSNGTPPTTGVFVNAVGTTAYYVVHRGKPAIPGITAVIGTPYIPAVPATATTPFTPAVQAVVAVAGVLAIPAECTSLPKKVEVTITLRPKLTVSQPAAVCEPSTIDLTSPTIVSCVDCPPTPDYHYYTDMNLTNELTATATSSNPAYTAVTSGTYYVVEQTYDSTNPNGINGCKSEAKAIIVKINPKPKFTLNNSLLKLCPSVMTDLTKEVPSVNISLPPAAPVALGTFTYYQAPYDASVLPVSAPITTTPAVASLVPATAAVSVPPGFNYYVQFENSTTGCKSDFEVLVIEKYPVLTPPTVTTNLPAVCAPAKVNLEDAVTSSLVGCKFYSDAALTIELIDREAAWSGKYYVVTTNAFGCKSTKKEINIVVHPKLQFLLDQSVEVCSGSSVDIATKLTPAIAPPNQEYIWWNDYDPLTGALTNAFPTTTTATTIAEAATGSGLTDTFYVQLVYKSPHPSADPLNLPDLKGCPSEVQGINVTIYPKEVVAVNLLEVCGENDTVDLITAINSLRLDGTYAFFENGSTTALTNTVVSSAGTMGTYEVQFTNTATTCTSDLTGITITKNIRPTLVVNTISANKCETDAIATPIDLMSFIPTAQRPDVQFYTDAALLNPIANNFISAAGVYTFYAQYTDPAATVCIKSEGKPVTFTIYPKPAAPVITLPAAVCGGAGSAFDLSTLVPNTTDYKFYDIVSGGMALTGTAITAATGPEYWVEFVSTNGCKSDRTKIELNRVNLLKPIISVTNPVAVCATNTINLLNTINPNTLVGGYTFYTDNNLTSLHVDPVTGLSTSIVTEADVDPVTYTHTFYVQFTVTATGCASDLMPIIVTINKAPSFTLLETDLIKCSVPGSTPETINLWDALSPKGPTQEYHYSTTSSTTGFSVLPSSPFTITDTSAGLGSSTIYYVKLVDNNPILCGAGSNESDVKVITVTFNSKPDFIVTNPVTVCAPVKIELTNAVPTSMAGTYAYFVSNTATTAMISTEIDFPVTAVTSTSSYWVEFTNSTTNCKSERKEIKFTVNSKPTVSLVSPLPSPICYGGSIDLTTYVPALTLAGEIYEFSEVSDFATILAPGSTTITETVVGEGVPSTIYYVRVKNTTTGCISDSENFTIEIYKKPEVIVHQPAPVCEPNTIDLTDTSIVPASTTGTYEYFIESSPGVITILTNPSAPISYSNALATTKYYVEFTNSTTNCKSGRKEILVDINEQPMVTLLISPPSPVCSGSLIDLTTFVPALLSPNEIYEFSELSNFSILLGSTTVSESIVGAGLSKTYYVRVKNIVTGCVSNSESFPVKIYAKPVLIVTQPTAQCDVFDLASLTFSVPYNALTHKFYSDYTASTVMTPDVNGKVEVSTGGTYYVQYTNTNSVTSISCLSDVEPITVVINTKPIFTAQSVTICGDATTTVDLTQTVPVLSNGSYRFYTKNASNVETNVSDATKVTDGTYYVVFTNSVSGCSSLEQSISVTINIEPVLMLTTQPTTLCEGDVINLIALNYTLSGVIATKANLTYYSDASLTAASKLSLSEAANIKYNGTYYVTYTNSSGNTCVSVPVAVQTNFYSDPKINVNQPAAICAGGTVDLNATVTDLNATTTGGVTVLTGIFKFYTSRTAATASPNSPLASASVTPSVTTDYFVKFTSTLGGCHSEVKKITVSVKPIPTVTVNQPAAVCAVQTIDLRATVPTTTVGTYKFYKEDVGGMVELTGSDRIVSVSTTATPLLKYYVKFMDTFTGCESLLEEIDVTINPKPVFTIDITQIPAVCSPTTVNMTSTIVRPTGVTMAAADFKYYKDQYLTVPVLDATAVTEWRKYYVLYEDPTTNCKSDVKEIDVVINPQPTFIVTSPAAVCEPTTIDLTDTSIVPASSIGTYTYFVDNNPTTAPMTPNTNTGKVEVSATGIYYVQLTNTTTTCVSVKLPITVTINPKPTFTLIPAFVPLATAPDKAEIKVCSPDRASLYSAVPASTTGSYEFYTDSGLLNTVSNTQIGSNGTFYVTLTDNTTGCVSDKKEIKVIINDKPVLTVTQPAAICAQNTFPGTQQTIDLSTVAIQNNTTSNISLGSYHYYSDASLIASSELTGTNLVISSSGTYYVVFKSEHGCLSDKKQIIIKVNANPSFTLVNNTPAFTEVCAPATIDLSIFAPQSYLGTYLYYKVTGTTRGAALTSLSVTGSGTYDIQFTNTVTGCVSDFQRVILKINAKPILTLASSSKTVCSGAIVDLSATEFVTPTISGSFLTYKFYSDASLLSEMTLAQFTNITASGNYYVQLENTNTGCKSDKKKIEITINPTPGPVVIIQPAAVCTGSINLLTTVPTIATSVGSYKFYDDISKTTEITDLNITATNTFYVQFTTAAGSCESPVTGPINIEINVTPTFDVIAPTTVTVCSAVTVDLTTKVTTPTVAGGTWAYSINSNLSSTLSAVEIAAATANIYYVQYTTAKGCKSSIKTITVISITKPVVILNTTAVAPVCEGPGVSVNLTDYVTSSTVGSYKYYTDLACTPANEVTVLDITIADLGTTSTRKYYVKLVLSGGCESDVEEITVTINKKPIFTLPATPPATICEYDTVELRDIVKTNVLQAAAADGMFKYYKKIDVNRNVIASSELIASATKVGAGTYYIQFTNTLTGCVSDVLDVTVTTVANPTISITSPAAVCEGTTIDLSTLVDSSANTGVYKYYSDSALGVANELTGSNLIIGSTGTYYVQYISNSIVCNSNVEVVTITVNKLPTFTVTLPTQVCDSERIDLRNFINSGFNQIRGEYTFYSNIGLTDVVVDKRITSDKSGIYYVDYTNENGCKSAVKMIDLTNMFINSPAKPTVIVTGYASCYDYKAPNSVTMNYNAAFDYIFSDPTISVDVSGIISGYNLSEVYTVQVRNRVTGCLSELTSFNVDRACIELTKTAIAPVNIKVGDKIIYSFLIKNTGTLPLNNIKLEDTLLGGFVTIAKDNLVKNEITTGQGIYIVTQADFDAGEIVNSAEVKGNIDSLNHPADLVTDKSDDGISSNGNDTPTVTPIYKVPQMELIKTANTEKYTLGQTVTYTFEVVNTGNVTLKDVKVVDKLAGLSRVRPSEVVELLPGDTEIFTAEYVITKRDVDNEKVENTAIVYAIDPNNSIVEDVSDNDTPDEDVDGDGDKGNDSTIITAEFIEDIKVYNLFSPYSDDNKVLLIESKVYDKISVSVFNRWGHTLYSNEDYKNNWDGKVEKSKSSTISLGSNEYIPTGTYFYMIHAINTENGMKTTKKGWLYIVTK